MSKPAPIRSSVPVGFGTRMSTAFGAKRSNAYARKRSTKISRRTTAGFLQARDLPLILPQQEPGLLEKILKIMSIFDAARSIFDTSIMIVLAVFFNQMRYRHASFDRNPQANVEAQEDFDAYQYYQLVATSCAVLVFAMELPMAFFLYRAIKKDSESSFKRHLRLGYVHLVLNLLVTVLIITFALRMRVMRDDVWFRFNGGRFCIACFIVRTTTFDLTKGSELVFVKAKLREFRVFEEEPAARFGRKKYKNRFNP